MSHSTPVSVIVPRKKEWKKCTTCYAKLPSSDAHNLCLFCLGPDHITIDQTQSECTICKAFTPRAYSRRFYRLLVQRSSGIADKRISDADAKLCIRALKEAGTPFDQASTDQVRDLTNVNLKFQSLTGSQGQAVQPIEPSGGNRKVVGSSHKGGRSARHVSDDPSRSRGTPKDPLTGPVVERGAVSETGLDDTTRARIALVTSQLTSSAIGGKGGGRSRPLLGGTSARDIT